jgi:hypothetical protein
MWYQIVFLGKIFFNIIFLRYFLKDGKKFINRSKSTANLFWFRIWYDIIFFILCVFAYRYYLAHNGITEHIKSVKEVIAIIFPVAIKESIVFWVCVR